MVVEIARHIVVMTPVPIASQDIILMPSAKSKASERLHRGEDIVALKMLESFDREVSVQFDVTAH
jgi:hypothetical protein